MKFPQFEVSHNMLVNFYEGADRGQVPLLGIAQSNFGPPNGDIGIDVLIIQNGTSARRRNVYHIDHSEHIDHLERSQRSGGWDYVPGILKPWEVRQVRELLSSAPKASEPVVNEHRVVDLFKSATPINRICQAVGLKKPEVEAILAKHKLMETADA